MNLLNEEKETIILFNEAEKIAEIEVFSRPMASATGKKKCADGGGEAR